MAMMIKRGNRAPSLNDLDLYQLGFNKENEHLYIKTEENGVEKIVDFCEDSSVGSKVFRAGFNLNEILTRNVLFYSDDSNNRNSNNDKLLSLENDEKFLLSHLDINIHNKILYRILVYKYNDNSIRYYTFQKKLLNIPITYRASQVFGRNGHDGDFYAGDINLLDTWGCFAGNGSDFWWSEAEVGFFKYIDENNKEVTVYLNLFKPQYTWLNDNGSLLSSNIVLDKIIFDVSINTFIQDELNAQPGNTVKVNS